MAKEIKAPDSIRFVLEIGNIRSVIDSTAPKNMVKQSILGEIEALFSDQPVTEMGESRIVEGPGKWHLEGRYLREKIRYGEGVGTSTWKCEVCGCTDQHACPGGCHWVRKNLCSKCA
jgi:hypothetical protein